MPESRSSGTAKHFPKEKKIIIEKGFSPVRLILILHHRKRRGHTSLGVCSIRLHPYLWQHQVSDSGLGKGVSSAPMC